MGIHSLTDFAPEILQRVFSSFKPNQTPSARLTCRIFLENINACARLGHLGPIPCSPSELISNAPKYGTPCNELPSIKLTLTSNEELETFDDFLTKTPHLAAHTHALDLSAINVTPDTHAQIESILSKMTSLTHLSFGGILGVIFILPDSLNALTHLSFGNILGVISILPDSLNALTHLSFGNILGAATLTLPNSLNALTHLSFGRIFVNVTLSNSLRSLKFLSGRVAKSPL